MDAPIERLIVTRFDLALGLDLLKGHRPLPALGKNRDGAGALADVETYKAVARGEPFSLAAPRQLRFVPTGWEHHGSKFWRGFTESYVAGRDPQIAQALPIRAKIVEPAPTAASPGDAAPQSMVSAWFWPFAVATQLSVDSARTLELEDAWSERRRLLDGATWNASGTAPATGSSLFKAHRACMLEALFPKDARPRPNVRVDDFTITTLLAARETRRSPFNKWTQRDRALVFGALLGEDPKSIDAKSLAVTVADLKLDSFALLSFGENGGRGLLYLTQRETAKASHWSWCLTMNVANFVMTSLALACLSEDLRDDAGRAAQRTAAIAALRGLRACYRVRTDGQSITEKLFQNHTWVARAVGDKSQQA
jgi:hypothetical protein